MAPVYCVKNIASSSMKLWETRLFGILSDIEGFYVRWFNLGFVFTVAPDRYRLNVKLCCKQLLNMLPFHA